MNRMVGKHVDRARRVAEFARQHPSDLPGYQAALERIEERLARVTEVAQEEVGSVREERAAVARRLELREQLTADLQMVAGIARIAGRESVGTPIVLRYPGPRRNQLQFLNGARQVVVAATEREELLIGYGLPVGHLAALSGDLDRFAELLGERDAASRAHVGDRQQLLVLAQELRLVVEQMHVINRYRFRKDRALMAMWQAARDLRAGSGKGQGTRASGSEPLALPAGGDASRSAA
ncbi:MAG: hypothetical protein KJZ47_09100 [Gemmatimonadales bacterium]|nr:hypothetical protein [Gemmatimonadales bacterium]